MTASKERFPNLPIFTGQLPSLLPDQPSYTPCSEKASAINVSQPPNRNSIHDISPPLRTVSPPRLAYPTYEGLLLLKQSKTGSKSSNHGKTITKFTNDNVWSDTDSTRSSDSSLDTVQTNPNPITPLQVDFSAAATPAIDLSLDSDFRTISNQATAEDANTAFESDRPVVVLKCRYHCCYRGCQFEFRDQHDLQKHQHFCHYFECRTSDEIQMVFPDGILTCTFPFCGLLCCSLADLYEHHEKEHHCYPSL